MKKIGFIGVFDKTDLIIYLAKALKTLGKKVLIIDNTVNQKARYVVPAINPTKSYITEFDEIDVSVGFENYEDIKKYIGIPLEKELEYDIILIDVDSAKNYQNFNIQSCDKKYFITSFDMYSLKKGIEILSQVKETVKLTKVLFSKEISKEDNEYLDYISLDTKINWDENYIIYFPLDTGDQTVIIENQRISRPSLRKLSSQYKESLAYITEDIAKDLSPAQIKKAFKLMEKEV
ncbi:MAG: hypothetical protein HFJ53_06435 [Clostridia bacterium]|jgi:hypothetical protein|nr:hypothetical protein [Clostridia bacterium]